MKKKKKGLKKLKLNKNVVSNFDKEQVQGGTILTLACPQSIFCPTRFCPTRFNCPSLFNCPSQIGCPSQLGCPSDFCPPF